jgi:TPR repeat protein
MNPYLKSVLTSAMLCFGTHASAVEFMDYDYSRWSQEVTGCDLLATHILDPGHVGDVGVESSNMDKDAAIAACEIAVAKDPENPRLNYQLGRAYGYSNRGEEAMPYRLKAVEKEYPQSLFVIGYLYLLGRTIEQDKCKTVELWIKSAQYRRLAALVALPRHYMRGDFEGCGVNIPPDDLRAYLEEARATSGGDYYVNLLTEDLLNEWEAKYPK